jgi:hypothetical protein
MLDYSFIKKLIEEKREIHTRHTNEIAQKHKILCPIPDYTELRFILLYAFAIVSIFWRILNV